MIRTPNKVMMKNFLLCAALLTAAAATGAQDKLIAGLWPTFPLMGKPGAVPDRKFYIFTNEALTKPAVFSGLQDMEDSLQVICCIQVRNIVPLDFKAELRKQSGPDGIAEHLRSITGLKYMYLAEASPKSQWTPGMQQLMKFNSAARDGMLITMPVISVALTKPGLPLKFTAGGSSIAFKAGVSKKAPTLLYQLTIDSKPTRFSVEEQAD